MAISFPLVALFNNEVILTKRFQLMYRQDTSRLASGLTIARDYGTPLWVADFQTATLSHDDCIKVEAYLSALDGVTRKFTAWDTRRPYPLAYPTGSFSDSGSVGNLPTSVNQIGLKGLPANFQISVGDKFAIEYGSGQRTIHQSIEDVTANGSGVTSDFAIRPFRPADVDVNDVVTFKKPKGNFHLTEEPPQFNDAGQVLGTVSFKAIQAID